MKSIKELDSGQQFRLYGNENRYVFSGVKDGKAVAKPTRQVGFLWLRRWLGWYELQDVPEEKFNPEQQVIPVS